MFSYPRAVQVALVSLAFAGVVNAAQADRAATLAAAMKAVEAHFQSNDRVTSVTADMVPNVGGVLAITLRPATTERFEFFADTTYMHIWQALFKVPNAYTHIDRVRLTLTHPPKTLVIDCPASSVEDSDGYTDFARLKRLCRMQ